MKNKIAILYSGFMPDYLGYFIDICNEKNIKIDLLFFENNKIINNKINKLFSLKTKYKSKNIKLLFLLEKEIKNTINIEDYDYILSDCIGLSFGCNIFHYTSLHNKINVSNNKIIKFFSYIGHYKKLSLEKKQFKNNSKLIFVSNILKNDYINNCNIDESKSYVVYPGFNYEVKNINKVKNEDFTIGIVACGFYTKGGYTLLKAFKILKCNFKINKIKLKIINPKYKKYSILAFYIKILNLSKYIEFLPYQNDMSNFYNSIDCLVCASKYESFGRVVSEAMISNVPVIIGSNVGAVDVIKDNVNGFVFENNSKSYIELANKLKEVINKKNNLDEIKENAYNTAKILTWKNFANNLFSVLY